MGEPGRGLHSTATRRCGSDDDDDDELMMIMIVGWGSSGVGLQAAGKKTGRMLWVARRSVEML